MLEPSMTIKRPFCDCDESAVLTTAIYDRLLSNGTEVELGFYCPFCKKYYGCWVSDPSYWLLCRAVEEMVGVVTIQVCGEVRAYVHPSYNSGMVEIADDSNSRSG